MALHLTGEISFQDLVTEFKTGTPISLSQMYAGAGFVPEANKGVPKSGAISLGNFYGATAAFVLDYNVTADMFNLNSSTILANSSWDGIIPVILTINVATGIVVSGNSTATPAMVINALPDGSQVFINNNGYIIGMGGAGNTWNGGVTGGTGGTALQLNTPTRLNNLGTIGGGGGGGSGVNYGTDRWRNARGGGGRSGRQNSVGNVQGTFTSAGAGDGVVGNTPWTGAGGNWGANGAVSTSHLGSWAGGAGGKAVIGNSYVTWVSTGTIAGALT